MAIEKKVNHNIRAKETGAVRANIESLRGELRTLRNAKASSGSASKLAKISTVRRNIARNLTILNEKERKTLAGELHKNSRKRPQFLREKLTRAVRQRLTKQQRTKQIRKVQKRAQNFPIRKYGLKA